MYKIFSLFCILSIQLFAHSQNAGISTHYTSENGLLNNTVTCITQDKKGYLWLGSSDGLMRFDGYGFSSFFHSDTDSNSIVGGEVLDVFQDKHSDIWISTALGLSRFSHTQQRFTNFTNFREGSVTYSNYVTGVLDADSNKLWVSTAYGLHLFDPTSQHFHLFLFSHKGLSNADANYIRKITKDAKGNLWLGLFTGQLIYFDTHTHEYQFFTQHLKPNETNNSNNRITAMAVDSQNRLWAASLSGGVLCYHPFRGMLARVCKETKQLPNNSVLSLCITAQEQLLVGTNGDGWATFSVAGQIATPVQRSESLKSAKVSVLFQDCQHNIWTAYLAFGVEVFYARHNQFHSQQSISNSNLHSNSVLGLCVDRQNNLWLACDVNGLYCINRSTKQTTRYYSNLKNNFPSANEAVNTVFESSDGTIWVGSYTGGLSSISPDGKICNFRNNLHDPYSLSGNNIKHITQDSAGNIWMCVQGCGFSMFSRRTHRFTNYSINKIFKTEWKDWTFTITHCDSVLLITSTDGIVVYNLHSGKAQNFLADSDVGNKHRIGVIPYAYYDHAHRLWLATKNGLVQYDWRTDNYKVYSVADGFSANSIASIVEDGAGNLWLGSSQGLIRFNPTTLSVNNFTVQDGLPCNQFNYGACFKTPKGELLFGGTNGFTAFYPDSVRLNAFVPPVDITSLMIFNLEMLPNAPNSPLRKHISCTDTLFLSYEQSNLNFSFTALNLIQTEKNQYAYKLVGFDADWIYSKTARQANYTNLQPGNYQFVVRASNNDGVWNTKGRSIHIIIRPPFWKTLWAYLVYGLIIATLLYFFRRFTLISINEKHRLKLEHLEQEKRDAIHQHKLDFFTEISHEIRTPLTLIIDPVDRLVSANQSASPQQLLQLQGNIKKLYNLVDQLLDFRKIEATASLELSNNDILAFLQSSIRDFEGYAIEKSIAFSFNTPLSSCVCAFDAPKMEKIMNNLLTNAFKHTPTGGHISISLESHGNTASPSASQNIRIVVANSGKGIAPEHLERIFTSFYKADTETHGSGLGLAIVKALIELHHGSIDIQSQPNQGVQCILTLPFITLLDSSHQNTQPPIQLQPQADLSTDLTEKPLLLVVEDNAELRAYIKGLFVDRFHIEEAADGEQAWQKTKQLLPDIIISDVMMPIMDGKTFCAKVKSDSLTNHIPVILLTAQNLEQQKLDGLLSGANDFVIKPFKSQELLLKIANLLAIQANLKARLKRQIAFSPLHEPATTSDEEFIKQAESIIVSQIDNAEFDIEQFASALCISSRQLRRKLQTLAGITPVDMIRNIRLKHSLHLLKQQRYTVSEVAYMVGFNDPKYFSKLFVAQYGVLPSEIIGGK